MTKVEINQAEYKSLVELMSDAKVPIPLGYVLGNFMGKVEQAFQQEGEKQLKERFTNKKSECECDVKSKSKTNKRD